MCLRDWAGSTTTSRNVRKVQIDKAGGYEQLRVVDVPAQRLEAGEVRVATRGIGVNFADCVVRMGLYQSAAEYVGWPITPGFEFSGIVQELGAGVDSLQVGQQVMGVVRFGAYASEVRVPRAQLRELPNGVSLEQAGAVPVAFLTAWYALRELCKLRPGMRVLVHSGAGGVGLAAIQIARACGCDPIAVVGASHKRQVAEEYGAHAVIDKSRSDLWSELRGVAPEGVDVVLDPNGSETLQRSYDSLRPMGRLVVYGFGSMLVRGRGKPSWPKLVRSYLATPRFQPLRLTNENKSVMAFNLSYLFDSLHIMSEAFDELFGWFGSGALRPLPVQEFDLEAVAEAQRALESGSTTGKLLLRSNSPVVDTRDVLPSTQETST